MGFVRSLPIVHAPEPQLRKNLSKEKRQPTKTSRMRSSWIPPPSSTPRGRRPAATTYQTCTKLEEEPQEGITTVVSTGHTGHPAQSVQPGHRGFYCASASPTRKYVDSSPPYKTLIRLPFCPTITVVPTPRPFLRKKCLRCGAGCNVRSSSGLSLCVHSHDVVIFGAFFALHCGTLHSATNYLGGNNCGSLITRRYLVIPYCRCWL